MGLEFYYFWHLWALKIHPVTVQLQYTAAFLSSWTKKGCFSSDVDSKYIYKELEISSSYVSTFLSFLFLNESIAYINWFCPKRSKTVKTEQRQDSTTSYLTIFVNKYLLKILSATLGLIVEGIIYTKLYRYTRRSWGKLFLVQTNLSTVQLQF